jgi:hypothetical protein
LESFSTNKLQTRKHVPEENTKDVTEQIFAQEIMDV